VRSSSAPRGSAAEGVPCYAIPLMTGQAESIFEGMLRMLHVVSGIEVVPQYVVRTEDGAFVARGDLLLAGTRTLHELDGGHHRSATQHGADLRRDRRLLEAGYERRGYTSSDVLTRAIGILRDADRTLGRVHDPARIHAWYALLQQSLFTPSGQARLARRLGLAAENAEDSSA
jgi:very-short-patch-repair endonuclease